MTAGTGTGLLSPLALNRDERLPRPKAKTGRPLRSTNPQTGRQRANYWYTVPDACDRCEKAGKVERHHKDSNPLNNDAGNIAFLCRRCHMEVDGRLSRTYDATCKSGRHPRTAENTYVNPRTGVRQCRECQSESRRRKRKLDETLRDVIPGLKATR